MKPFDVLRCELCLDSSFETDKFQKYAQNGTLLSKPEGQ